MNELFLFALVDRIETHFGIDFIEGFTIMTLPNANLINLSLLESSFINIFQFHSAYLLQFQQIPFLADILST